MNATYGALSTSLMGSVVKPNIWEQPTEDFTSSSLHEGGKMAVGVSWTHRIDLHESFLKR